MSLGKWQRQVACCTLCYKPWPACNASLILRPSFSFSFCHRSSWFLARLSPPRCNHRGCATARWIPRKVCRVAIGCSYASNDDAADVQGAGAITSTVHPRAAFPRRKLDPGCVSRKALSAKCTRSAIGWNYSRIWPHRAAAFLSFVMYVHHTRMYYCRMREPFGGTMRLHWHSMIFDRRSDSLREIQNVNSDTWLIKINPKRELAHLMCDHLKEHLYVIREDYIIVVPFEKC